MNPSATTNSEVSADIEVTTSDVDRVERALIDASTRLPVLVFYTSGIVWVRLSTLFGILTSFQIHSPDFLTDVPFLTWGRIRPVHLDALIYGWASMAGM